MKWQSNKNQKTSNWMIFPIVILLCIECYSNGLSAAHVKNTDYCTTNAANNNSQKISEVIVVITAMPRM